LRCQKKCVAPTRGTTHFLPLPLKLFPSSATGGGHNFSSLFARRRAFKPKGRWFKHWAKK